MNNLRKFKTSLSRKQKILVAIFFCMNFFTAFCYADALPTTSEVKKIDQELKLNGCKKVHSLNIVGGSGPHDRNVGSSILRCRDNRDGIHWEQRTVVKQGDKTMFRILKISKKRMPAPMNAGMVGIRGAFTPIAAVGRTSRISSTVGGNNQSSFSNAVDTITTYWSKWFGDTKK